MEIRIDLNSNDVSEKLNDVTKMLLLVALNVLNPLATTVVNQMTALSEGKRIPNAKRVAFVKNFASTGNSDDVFTCYQTGLKDKKESLTVGTGTRQAIVNRLLFASTFEDSKVAIVRTLEGKEIKSEKSQDDDEELSVI